MEYAMITVPAAPVRRKSRHQSEMTNQLLFGDSVKVLKEKKGIWVKVRCLYDNYEGWMTSHQLQEVDENEARMQWEFVNTSFLNTAQVSGLPIHLPLGCFLPGMTAGEGKIGEQLYRLEEGYTRIKDLVPTPELINKLSRQWINAPYLWGGKTLLGVDCSGFVQVNYRMMGIDLPRDAWQQAQEGTNIGRLRESQPGDLVFFDDREEIVHVGILLGNDQVIHASGKVRIDSIDKKGIVNSETGRRTHSLRVIKRCR